MEMPELSFQFYPGFPSLFVPYGPCSDLFFSGHCGAMLILMLEFWAVGHWTITVLYIPVLLYMSLVMVLLHNHYSVGMFVPD